jgi:hypothetical protein
MMELQTSSRAQFKYQLEIGLHNSKAMACHKNPPHLYDTSEDSGN